MERPRSSVGVRTPPAGSVSVARRAEHPGLRLQRTIGNREVGRWLDLRFGRGAPQGEQTGDRHAVATTVAPAPETATQVGVSPAVQRGGPGHMSVRTAQMRTVQRGRRRWLRRRQRLLALARRYLFNWRTVKLITAIGLVGLAYYHRGALQGLVEGGISRTGALALRLMGPERAANLAGPYIVRQFEPGPETVQTYALDVVGGYAGLLVRGGNFIVRGLFFAVRRALSGSTFVERIVRGAIHHLPWDWCLQFTRHVGVNYGLQIAANLMLGYFNKLGSGVELTNRPDSGY